MSTEWAYIPGNQWCICTVCGFKYRRSDMRLRWDNVWACPEDWETRQPQDYVKSIPDVIVVYPQLPPPTDEFIEVCSLTGRQGIADYGTADCALADMDFGER
jgi:hypothetical protein